jgi:cytochrome c-type biogenesis protein CcmF
MNRGGSVPSVHSFGASQLGWIFLLFLAVGVIVPFAIFIWRYPLLKSVQNLDSMLSREAAFLVNNMLLLAIAFVTLWGTVYPLLSRLTNDEEITVARPFYDQVNGPLMLGLVFLMGVGPLIPWRKAGMASLRRSLLPPVVGGLLTVGILAALGLHKDYALIAFGLATFVTTGILMEWFRGMRSRHRNSGENYVTAFLRLIAANRPRYGGYIVHLSVVMVTLGIVGTSFFGVQRDVVLSPGESTTINDYELVYLGTVEVPKSNRTEFTSTVQVFRDGELLDTIRTKRAFYPSFNMAATTAAIRSTPVEDLYVVPSENLPDGSVGFRILVNPLIWWMWVAGPVMVLGTVIALWPQKIRAPVPARPPRRFAPGSRPSAA